MKTLLILTLLALMSCNKALYKENSTHTAFVTEKTKFNGSVIKTNKLTDIHITVSPIKSFYIWGSDYEYLDDNKRFDDEDIPTGFNLEDNYSYTQLGVGYSGHLLKSFVYNVGVFRGFGISNFFDSNSWENQYWRVKAKYKKQGLKLVFGIENKVIDYGLFLKRYNADFYSIKDGSKSFKDDYHKPKDLQFLERGIFIRLKANHIHFELIYHILDEYKSNKIRYKDDDLNLSFRIALNI